MSSIRLFILGSLDSAGPMHGHQLRLLAEEERIHLWTDVSVGSLYGAIKRLANEGLIEEVRVEREGSYPERQVFEITAEGRRALSTLRESGLSVVDFRNDPFDLAMARLDPDSLDELVPVIETRVLALRTKLAEQQFLSRAAAPYLSVAEAWVMQHRVDRLTAEVDSHERLLSLLPDIIADEKARKATPHD
ncbi:PadR family transcriptional regulator [Herbiconiux sp. UC225_62]|uniref:PadR family transcriptional regulator n=1 Tax=Herbiconiux sp. UC225_62 TaxID=3350168 RepID=UPI0036D307CF